MDFRDKQIAMRGEDEIWEQPKPTRYDRIRQDMTIYKMAELRVIWNNDPNHYMGGYYMCNGASGIYKTQQNAIAAEIEYLKGVE